MGYVQAHGWHRLTDRTMSAREAGWVMIDCASSTVLLRPPTAGWRRPECRRHQVNHRGRFWTSSDKSWKFEVWSLIGLASLGGGGFWPQGGGGGGGGRKLEYWHSFIAIYPLLCGKGPPSGERIFPPGERILSTTFATTVATNDCVCGESATNVGHEFWGLAPFAP